MPQQGQQHDSPASENDAIPNSVSDNSEHVPLDEAGQSHVSDPINNTASEVDITATSQGHGSVDQQALPHDIQQPQSDQHELSPPIVVSTQETQPAPLQHAKSGNLFGSKSIDRLLINLINSMAMNSIKENEITVWLLF
jgi:hypothetical protein